MNGFKEFFFETYDLDLLMEGTTAQTLKANQDQELIKLIKAQVSERLIQIPFFSQPMGKKMLPRHINFFTYQILQDESWMNYLQKSLADIDQQNPRFALNVQEIKQNAVKRVGGAIGNMWRDVGDYFAAMGDRIASKLNNPAYTLRTAEQESEEWHAELASRERGLPDQAAKTFLTLDHLGKRWKGWKWVDLGKGYCPEEARAMGHCGNQGAAEGDNIVSLRDAEGYAHLTFIINDGFIGEAKGRGNDKPSEKYHAPIVELLKSNYVDSIKGGGYAPENNFHFDDLHDDHKKELEHKPHINDPIGHSMEKYKNNPKKLVGAVNEFFGTVFEDFDGNNFIVEDFEESTVKTTNRDGKTYDKWVGPYTAIEEKSSHWENGPIRVGWLDDDAHFDNQGYHGLNHSELLDKLNAENIDKIKEIISASRDDLDGGIDEYDLEELVDEDEDISQALDWAAGDAAHSGNMAEAYRSVQQQLGSQDENGFWIDFKEYPWKLKISAEDVKNLYKEMVENETIDQEDIDHMITLSYSEPQGGHYGDFDDEEFNERVSDHLHNIAI